jgi:choline kinase|tara:strand:- start:247 stop:1011 length:765 start_codon:yes stop_codon:yes gene_type:complete
MKHKKINAIILAAGEGTRLRPYTLDYPKCMVEIDGKSLIDRQLDVLEHERINDIIIIGGYKIEMLKGKGDRLKENPRYFETNMVWTLFSANEELTGELIVSYGDIVYSKEILETLLNSTSDISVIIDQDWETYWRARSDNPLDDAETLRLTEDGRIIEIGQKPESIEEIQGQYIGLIKLTAFGVSQIKAVFQTALENGSMLGKSLENSYMTDLIQATINAGIDVTSVPVKGGWVEVDTIDDMKATITSRRLKMI